MNPIGNSMEVIPRWPEIWKSKKDKPFEKRSMKCKSVEMVRSDLHIYLAEQKSTYQSKFPGIT